jgi:hypothetical protein
VIRKIFPKFYCEDKNSQISINQIVDIKSKVAPYFAPNQKEKTPSS